MYSQHALIVDDSKTAQLRLKRMLEVYELEIDIASSAEEALAYLSYRVPAVVFLDKSMQGMDGMEALRTIKANPSTATIPVIMYTSEHGSVFTSQARALGALDILNKNALAPSNLESILSQLKIAPRKKSAPSAAEPKSAVALNAEQASTPKKVSADKGERSALDEIQLQIARLFEIHIADVGRQISKSTQFLAKRLHAQTENVQKTPVEVVIGDLPLDVINREVSAERRRIAVVSNGMLALVFVGLIVVGALLVNVMGDLSSVSDNHQQMVALAESNNQQMQRLTQTLSQQGVGTATQVDPRHAQQLQLLTWLANADFGFGIDEEPLGEYNVGLLQQMVTLLENAGYQGVVEININLGNHCLSRSTNGNLTLAANDLPVFNCILRSSVEKESTPDAYLTLAFLNLERNISALRDRHITLEVKNVSFDNPRYPYPFLDNDTKAAEWNRIASQNNYLSFALASF